MTLLRYEQLEIVGFEGTVVVECEMVLPVARLKETDLFFKFPTSRVDSHAAQGIDDESLVLYSREQIEALASDGEITLLSHPLSACPNAMVAYVISEFLTAAGSQLPNSLPNVTVSEETWAICAPSNEIEKLLDGWATLIMNNSTLLLEEYFVAPTEQLSSKVERLTDMALCAASDQTLRARIYERAGLAVMFSSTPERLDNLYHLSVGQQFSWTWEMYRERLERLVDVLKLRANYNRQELVIETEESVNPVVLSPADTVSAEFDELRKHSDSIRSIVDPNKRYARCETIAKEYRDLTIIPDGWYELAVNYINEFSEVSLTNEIIKTLKCEPLIYYVAEKVVDWPKRTGNIHKIPPKMDSAQFLKEAQELRSQSKNLGEVGLRALKNHDDRKKCSSSIS